MKLTYTQSGDYLFPNLKLRDPPDAPPLGWYGQLRKAYLEEHRPIMYSKLLLSEKLYSHCHKIDKIADIFLSAIQDKKFAKEFILTEVVYR